MDQRHKIEIKFIKEIPVITIEGDMTSETDHEIIDAVQKNRKYNDNSNAKLIINFGKTNYINSAGIATLINIIQTTGESKSKIAFVALSPHFQKVMEIVGIIDFVKQANTDEEAAEILNKL